MESKHNEEELESLLSRTIVPPDLYRSDVELFDRSQKLAAEFLRLSLAGIAVIGFFLTKAPSATPENLLGNNASRLLFAGSALASALAALFALLQMFYASGSMFHHMNSIKLLQLNKSTLHNEVEREMKIRGIKFKQAHVYLKTSAMFLALAACLLGAAFVKYIYP